MKKLAATIVLSFLCVIFFSYAGDAIGSMQNEKPAWKIQQKDGKKAYDLSTILVKFKEGITKKQRYGLASLVGGKFKDKDENGIDDRYEHILGGRLALIELKDKKGKDLASQALLALQHHPFIEYAEYNYLQYIDSTPNDPRFGELWGLNNTGQTDGTADADIDAPEAWDFSTGSTEVIVGVIDTGIDYNHLDLKANIWTNRVEANGEGGIDDDGNGYVDDIHGWDFYNDDNDPMDDNDHGTHCSGTIGAVGDNSVGVVGVSWTGTVKLIGMKFLNSGGSGTTADAIKCVDYAVALKNNGVNIRVLSNSWGGGLPSQGLKDAIIAANDAGILFVASAGNYNLNNDTSPHYPSSYDVSNVLAVASTDHNDNLSSFSCYGPTSVDLGAPGSDILSTTRDNEYDTFSGTSMATPHVSGAAALLLSVNDQLTVPDLKDCLMEDGDPLGALDGMCVSGKRLNAYGSLSQVPLPPESWTTVSYTNNTKISIPDNDSTGITSTIEVLDPLTVWNTACKVNITHTWIGDLIVTLTSPKGTESILHNRSGGSLDNIYQTYYPTEFRNEDYRGTWTLSVSDNAGLDLGTLDSWTLTIDGVPTGPVNQAPTVTITAPPNGSTFNEEVSITFTGTATDPDPEDEDEDLSSTIDWTSSLDGDLGTGASIEATLSDGTHIITATATDSGSKSGSDSITVTIGNAPPVANFSVDNVKDGKRVVTFTDNSTDDGTIDSWSWDFGDDGTSTDQDPEHMYPTSRTYTVTLTVTDDGGATDSISIPVKPIK